MAIIYSYPINTNILATDIIVGSSTAIFNGRPKNQTKSFEIQDLATYFASVILPPGSYVPYTGATGPVNLGAYDLTLNGATIGRGGGQVYSNIVFGLSSLLNNTTGQNNTYLGFSSGYYNTIGSYNTAIGTFASQFTTTGDYNTAIGNNALYTNTTGSYNLAIGSGALFSNTTGLNNTSIGVSSLKDNTIGYGNTAVGLQSMFVNINGIANTAIGVRSLYNVTIGNNNVGLGFNTTTLNPTDTNSIVIGYNATGIGSQSVVLGNSSITTTRLRGNVHGGAFIKDGGTNLQYLLADGSVTTGPVLTGFVPYTGATQAVNLGAFNLLVNGASVGIGAGNITSNTAMGDLALSSNTTGTFNSAFGSQSMLSNTGGRYNSAYGHQSLQNNTTGQYNTAVGLGSLFNNTSALYNTASGFQALLFTTTGGENSAYGRGSLRNNTTGIQNVGFGAFSYLLNATDSNCIVIGYNVTGAGSNTVTLGNTSITTTRLRGAVQGGSFVKDSGTVYETLLANGSVSTNGTLYKATSTAYQLVSGTSYFYSAVIPSNIFASGDNLKVNTVTATTVGATAAVITRYYINTTPSIVGATQIANWSGALGSVIYPMDRTYWVNGGNFYARNFTASSPNSSNTGAAAITSTPIPGGSFYIIVEIITTGTDLAGLLNFQILKT